MHRFLRKNKEAIVWFIVISFIFGGVIFGYGAYLASRNNPRAAASSQMALVNKEPITAAEFYAVFQQYANYLQGIPSDYFLMYQYETLNDLIENKLLLQEAKRQKIKVNITEEDVDKYIEDLKNSSGITDEKLNELLKENNLTMAKWRENIKESLKGPKSIEVLLDSVVADITVSEKEIIDEYEKVRVSSIFVNATEDEKGKNKIGEALEKINGGTEFKEVVKEYSESTNKTTGGDLGYLTRNSSVVDEKVITTAFSLEVGQVSEIIETDKGYYLIKTTDKILAQGEEFESQKEEIKNRLLNLKNAQAQSQWFQNLRSKAKIEIKVPELAGYEAFTQKEYETAIKKFKEAIDRVPSNEAFYSYLAQSYKGLRQNDKAIETYLKAMENTSVSWNIYYDLAMTYKEINEIEKAVVNLQKASEEAGDEKWAHDTIKKAFESLGYKDLALKEEAILNEIATKEAEEAKKLAEEAKANEQTEANTTEEDAQSKETGDENTGTTE